MSFAREPSNPANCGETPQDIGAGLQFQDCLDRLYKLVGVPYKFNSWDLTANNGINCIGLLVEYAKIANFEIPWDEFPEPDYSNTDKEWYYGESLADKNYYLKFVELIGKEVSVDERQPGDILIFKLGNTPYHVGILLMNNRILHTGFKTQVVISRLGDPLLRRTEKCIRPKYWEK